MALFKALLATVRQLESARKYRPTNRGCTRPPPIRITATSVRVRRSPQHLATPTRAPRAHEVPGYAPSGGCKGEQADGQSRAPPADPAHPQERTTDHLRRKHLQSSDGQLWFHHVVDSVPGERTIKVALINPFKFRTSCPSSNRSCNGLTPGPNQLALLRIAMFTT